MPFSKAQKTGERGQSPCTYHIRILRACAFNSVSNHGNVDPTCTGSRHKKRSLALVALDKRDL